MKDRLLLSDEEEEYLIRKCSKMLLILTVVLTFAFGKLKLYKLK